LNYTEKVPNRTYADIPAGQPLALEYFPYLAPLNDGVNPPISGSLGDLCGPPNALVKGTAQHLETVGIELLEGGGFAEPLEFLFLGLGKPLLLLKDLPTVFLFDTALGFLSLNCAKSLLLPTPRAQGAGAYTVRALGLWSE